MLQSSGECYIDSPPPTMSSRATPCLFAQSMLLPPRGFVRHVLVQGCAPRLWANLETRLQMASFLPHLLARPWRPNWRSSRREAVAHSCVVVSDHDGPPQLKMLLWIVAQAWHKGRKCAPMSCTIQESSDTITLDAC